MAVLIHTGRSCNKEQTWPDWYGMTSIRQSRRRLILAKCAAWSFLLAVATNTLGGESGMIYPDDFDDIPIGAYDSLGETERVAYCIYWLEAEVNNGGFHQFFFNSSGLLTHETLKALDAIGAQTTKNLLIGAAAAAYESGFPTDPTNHQELLRDDDETMGILDELDSLFYRYEDDLSALVNHYLANSKEH